jgi:phosphodiesterase/alkaline phosphatase D-like protein
MNDFSPAENTLSNDLVIDGPTLYRQGLKAFRDYAPARWSAGSGLYRKVRWGRNLELFFLDERSFRSAKADGGGLRQPADGAAGPRAHGAPIDASALRCARALVRGTGVAAVPRRHPQP